VALDDALAMTLYGLGTSLAQILTGGAVSLSGAALTVGIEIGGAVICGLMLGLLLNFVMRWLYQKDKTLVISLSIILLTIGVAVATGMDIIVATMTLGVTLVNVAPRRSKELFSLVRNFSIPIYVIFFVLVGARLNVGDMPGWLWLVVALYVLLRSAGKMAGAYYGARLSGAADVVQQYSGMGLFAQGGVAVGLSIVASQHLGDIAVGPGLSLGDAIIFGVTATTLIVQIIGPPMVKLAINRSGEIDRNVTEEDIVSIWKAKDAMEKESLTIGEHESLNRVFKIFADHENLSYPVVDDSGRMLGILTLERLKDIMSSQETWEWLVAGDVMIPVEKKVYAESPLKEAIELMEQLHFDRLPIVKSAEDDTAVGILDSRRVRIAVGEEVLKRRRIS
jgi:CBS domain-containing protein